jgi:hypothetical protein
LNFVDESGQPPEVTGQWLRSWFEVDMSEAKQKAIRKRRK